MTLDPLTREAVQAYADLHRVSFPQALKILVSIGLEQSQINQARIAREAHLRRHAGLAVRQRDEIAPEDFPV